MTSHLVQAYVDKENTTSLAGNSNKNRISSLAGRQAVKTFSVGESPMVTPRRALGNLSNDAARLSGLNTSQKKPLKSAGGGGGNRVFKKPLGSQAKTPGLSLRKPNIAAPSAQTAPKPKLKHPILTASSNLLRPTEVYPDVETMHVYQDKEEFEPVPQEDCLSSCLDRLASLRVPSMPHTRTTLPHGKHTDFSSLQLESNDRLSHNTMLDFSSNSFDVNLPIDLNSCLDLPPLDTVSFMDINSFKLWDEQSTD
ncbi:uncharacterized protein [Asterias amurensis]|uniref:uncharacterized protein n=1 Tax=Asterias amurensis TaxID=7602 RepID=UPI003AB77CA9